MEHRCIPRGILQTVQPIVCDMRRGRCRGVPVDTYDFSSDLVDEASGFRGSYKLRYKFAVPSWHDGAVTGDRPLQEVSLLGTHAGPSTGKAVKVPPYVVNLIQGAAGVCAECAERPDAAHVEQDLPAAATRAHRAARCR
jgi:hypothetical protein